MLYKNIYEDFYWTTTGTSVEYQIQDEKGQPVFNGRAFAGDGENIRINVAQKIRDWLENEIGDFREADGEFFDHPDAIHAFSLLVNGEVEEQWMVLYTWEPWSGDTLFITDKINGHASPMMKLFITNGAKMNVPTYKTQSITDGGAGGGPDNPGEGGEGGGGGGGDTPPEPPTPTGETLYFIVTDTPDVPASGGVSRIYFDSNINSGDLTYTKPDNVEYVGRGYHYFDFRFPANTISKHYFYDFSFAYTGTTLDSCTVRQLYTGEVVPDNPGEPLASDYFTVEAIETGNLTLSGPVQYKMVGNNWVSLSANTPVRVFHGDKIQLKGASFPSGITFRSTSNNAVKKKFNVWGNPLSLYWGDNFEGKTTTGSSPLEFPRFIGEYVVNASGMYLPLETVKNTGTDGLGLPYGQYSRMFMNCPLLQSAPRIFASTVEDGGCNYMFNGCRLAEAPAIDATTVGVRAFERMFGGCKFSTPPYLHVQNLAYGCFEEMFMGCENLKEAPNLPWMVLAEHCYDSMFHGCVSLRKAPELPATEVRIGCYHLMFYGCTSLTESPVLRARYVMSSDDPHAQYGQGCYNQMFAGCSNLSQVTVYATEQSGYTSPFSSWLDGVSATGVMYKRRLPEATGVSGVPAGWRVEYV